MDPRLEALCSTHGVFLRKEAVALGYRDDVIARMVREKQWHRVRRGAYVSGETWRAAENDERYRLFVHAAVRQADTAVVPSHVSAVALHGGPLWGLPLDHAHLTRRDARTGRKAAGVQQHRGILLPGDVVQLDGLDVMAPTRAALEASTQGSVEAAICVFEYFLHHELTTRERLQKRLEQMDRWPHTLHTDLALGLSDPCSESVGESRTGFLIWRHHLPAVQRQLEVYDEHGRLVGRVDFAWPEHELFLEFDGWQKYLKYRREGESIEDAIRREKKREELICLLTGWRCIRVTWADLDNPEVLARRIRNLLEARTPNR